MLAYTFYEIVRSREISYLVVAVVNELTSPCVRKLQVFTKAERFTYVNPLRNSPIQYSSYAAFNQLLAHHWSQSQA